MEVRSFGAECWPGFLCRRCAGSYVSRVRAEVPEMAVECEDCGASRTSWMVTRVSPRGTLKVVDG